MTTHTANNSELTGKTLVMIIGGFLTTIISLSVILGWKFDSSIAAQCQDLRKEAEEKYVMKELYRLQIDTIETQLKAIAKAVGARVNK